jgi:DNA-binding MarR family transcriptional regulator
MNDLPDREAVGTMLRHALELLDGDVAKLYGELGLGDYRPRFSPVVRALVSEGRLSIRDLALRVGVTHSAASQTVAQMARAGLVALEPGSDARRRIVRLTPKAYGMLPTIQSEWAATASAIRELDEELPVPLADLLIRLVEALRRKPLRQRIAESRPALGAMPGIGDQVSSESMIGATGDLRKVTQGGHGPVLEAPDRPQGQDAGQGRPSR